MTFETMSVRSFGVTTVTVAIGSLLVGTILSVVAFIPLTQNTTLETLVLSSLAMGVVAMVVVSLIYVFSTLTLTIIAYAEGEIPVPEN